SQSSLEIHDNNDDYFAVELNCGTPAIKPKRCVRSMVVSGCVSKPHSWPWQTALQTNERIDCGGTLIHPQWILTSDLCLSSSQPSAVRVVLGMHSLRATEPSRQVRMLEKIVTGPDGSNIALLKLVKSDYTHTTLILCVLSAKKGQYLVPGGTMCYVTGWGRTQGIGGGRILEETGFPVIDNKICNRDNDIVADHEICAGNTEGGKPSCQV
uniref:Peptidase S1 domain-containing protein n=1 Tax=Oreochromis aureus TaxID=47969 RepID=A0AAZ1XNI8_OREAU